MSKPLTISVAESNARTLVRAKKAAKDRKQEEQKKAA